MPRSTVKENCGGKFKKNVSLATNGIGLKKCMEKVIRPFRLNLYNMDFVNKQNGVKSNLFIARGTISVLAAAHFPMLGLGWEHHLFNPVRDAEGQGILRWDHSFFSA